MQDQEATTRKKKKPSYLAISRILGKKRYEQEYKPSQRAIATVAAEEKLRALKKQAAYKTSRYKYSQSGAGRFGRALSTGYTALSQRGGITRATYGMPEQTAKQKYGKRGRPKGTLDRRYAAYGGVYGWRKAMAQQRALQRLQAQRRATITPQQQAVINQVQARQQYQQSNPEGRIIPSTDGNIYLDGIMDEINRAANAVR